MKVKICGLTNIDDALLAQRHGAHHLGFILCESPRQISVPDLKSLLAGLPAVASTIGVFKDSPLQNLLATCREAPLRGVQLHGAESADYVNELGAARPDLFILKAIRVEGEKCLQDPEDFLHADGLVFDSAVSHFQATERAPLSRSLKGVVKDQVAIFLAGGVSAGNVKSLIELHAPDGLDLSSSLESAVGLKDHSLVLNFFETLKRIV